jgi:hypothetical protein
MVRACSTHGEEEECIWDFRVNARRKEPLGRPRRKFEDNIKMDSRGKRRRGMYGIHLA